MEDLRKRLDEIDSQLARLFDERMSVAADIARYKRCRSLPIEDKEREAAILARYDEHSHAFREMMEKVILLSKREQARHLNLYLVGMPDSGKTRFGKLLAPMLERSLADTDKLIMSHTSKTIDEIFDSHGEHFFRLCEHQCLLTVARVGDLVVATGGGVLTYSDNIALMRESGKVVFLNRSLDKLVDAGTRNRPLIRSGKNAIIALYNERFDAYRSAADFTIDPDREGAAEIIADWFKDAIARTFE